MDCNHIFYYTIGKELVTQLIGLAAPPNRPPHWSYGPLLSPICMVAIVKRLGNYSVASTTTGTGISSGGSGINAYVDGDDLPSTTTTSGGMSGGSIVGSKSERSELWGHLTAAIAACDDRPHSIQLFMISALQIRIISCILNKSYDTRYNVYTTTPTPDATTATDTTAIYRFRHLFPVDTSRTIFRAGHSEPVYIHCMMSKSALIHFLTPPLYYLFPIGIEAALNDDDVTSTSSDSNTGDKQSTMFETTETSKVSSLSQWLDNIESAAPTPTLAATVTPIHSAADTATYVEDPELIVSKKAYTTPISFTTTRHNNIQFSLADQVYINTSPTLPVEASKEAQKVWLSMEATINTIMNNLDCSIFPCTQATATSGSGSGGGVAGCDLVLIAKEMCKETYSDDTCESDTGMGTGLVKGDTYHIIAVDFGKDQSRPTQPEEAWEKKLDLLTSHRCIVPRLRAALKARDPSNELVHHIVLAGRPEHSWWRAG